MSNDNTMEVFIPNNQGKAILIDIEDWLRFKEKKWSFYNGYVRSTVEPRVFLQNYLLNTASKLDHINRIRLDCRKHNLRKCTHSQNCANKPKKHVSSSSKYKGVSWFSRDKYWRAFLHIEMQQIYLGRFDSEIDAALAYDKAARKRFGEFCTPNFIIT